MNLSRLIKMSFFFASLVLLGALGATPQNPPRPPGAQNYMKRTAGVRRHPSI